MNDDLTYTQTEELKKKMKAGTFNLEFEIKQLLAQGYQQERAKELLLKVFKSYKEDLFYEAKEAKEDEGKDDIALFAVLFSSLLISMFGNNNGFLILLSVVIACLAGYFGFPKKPVPAMVGYTVGALIMPFACSYYLSGRQSYLNLELVIPAAISFGPGYLIKYVLSKMMYPVED